LQLRNFRIFFHFCKKQIRPDLGKKTNQFEGGEYVIIGFKTVKCLAEKQS
jgi:hypothetical protein